MWRSDLPRSTSRSNAYRSGTAIRMPRQLPSSRERRTHVSRNAVASLHSRQEHRPGAGCPSRIGRVARGLVAATALLLLLPPGAVPAEVSQEVSPSLWERDRLTGDWRGLRSTLADRYGVDVGVSYAGDVFGVVSGGLDHRVEYLDDTDLTLTVDAEKLVGWKGGHFFVYGLGNYGGSPSAHVGDSQGIDNIDAPNTFKLYEAWYLQDLLDGRLSVLAGLYDLNGEFYATEASQLFINSSFGIGKDFSQSGRNGPSIFPTTSGAVRVKARPTDQWYVQAAVLDGVSGNPRNPNGTQIIFHKSDGVLVVAETAYVIGKEEGTTAPYGKYALGGWVYTARFSELAEEADHDRGNHGVYALAEQVVYRSGDGARALAVFLSIGLAEPRLNPFGFALNSGLVYTGLLPRREADQVGVGVASAHVGHDFRVAQRAAGTPVRDAEIALEFTYRLQLAPWLALQPDVQYVINPGVDSAIDNALALGSRFEIAF